MRKTKFSKRIASIILCIAMIIGCMSFLAANVTATASENTGIAAVTELTSEMDFVDAPGSPGTGDDRNVYLWTVLMVVGGAGIVITVICGKNGKRRGK